MAQVQASKLSSQELAQLACSYATLILHDDGQDVTSDRINKLLKAANVKVEAYWAKYFAKALDGKDISSFFSFGGSAAAAGAPAVADAPAPTKEAAKKDDGKGKGKKEQKQAPPPPPPAEEEEDMDMGDLFG